MGFFEKVKNMFTEEVEDDDVQVEQIKKEVTHVAIESPKIEEAENEEVEVFASNVEEKKPVFFDDSDFKDLNLDDEGEKIEIEEERHAYGYKLPNEEESKKNFKPTPIISPIYGVLDKNYHKEDIVSRQDLQNEKNVQESPIDTIRNKAYGTLEDELENTLFGANSILFKKDEPKKELEVNEVDDDVLTDLTDDISKELDELLIKKEKYVEPEEDIEQEFVHEEVADEKSDEKVEDEDLLGFIDSTLYKDGDE